MTTNAIEISGLVKRFGSTVALDDLTMTVPTGQVHGFLGPNGAGKSTTIPSSARSPTTSASACGRGDRSRSVSSSGWSR